MDAHLTQSTPAPQRFTGAWIALAIAAVLTIGALTSVWIIWGKEPPAVPPVRQAVPSAPGPDNSVTKAAPDAAPTASDGEPR